MMYLFSFKHFTEDKETVGGCGRRAWRWNFGFGTWGGWFGVWLGFEQQVKFLDKENEWYGPIDFVTVSLTRHWAWGSTHMYYDGPNCLFSLGFLHFSWRGENCKKCWGER